MVDSIDYVVPVVDPATGRATQKLVLAMQNLRRTAQGGLIAGPLSTTNGAIALWDGTDGLTLKDGPLPSAFATAAQGAKADSATQPDEVVLSLDDITDLASLNTEALVDGQQFSVNDNNRQRVFYWDSGSSEFKEAFKSRNIYDTLADLKSEERLTVGQKVETLGYFSAGDGGGNVYVIVAAGTGTDDGGSFIDLDSGLQARGLFLAGVNVRQFGANGTDDHGGIASAVSYAHEVNSELEWPAGIYVSDANIPDFHSVRHVGTGVIKRGSETFKVAPLGDQLNSLFVSTSGSDANDGLSGNEPFATLQAAVNSWSVYARQTAGKWAIKVAAGTYTSGAVIDGVRSATELLIEGELVGTTTATILDGTLTASAGINANAGVRVRTRYLHVKNFTSNGIAAQNGSYLTIDTCDISGCPTFGANASEFSDMNLVGACTIDVPAGGRGVRYYRQSTGSVGDGSNTILLQGGGRVCDGFQVRDNSYVVCNNGIVVDGFDNNGILLYRHSYLELRNATVSNNKVGIRVNEFGLLANLSGTVQYINNNQDTVWSGFSFPVSTPRNTIIGSDGASAQVASGVYDVVISNNGPSGIQALTGGETFHIDANFLNRISLAGDNSIRFTLNGTERYRLRSDGIVPIPDNDLSLGMAINRWSVLYSGTGTINTSDERSKQQVKPIDEAALRAWARVEYVQYKFNDAVEQKGGGARWHFGLIAQRVKEAFEAEGLDAFEYGLLCYDEWAESPAVEEQRDDDGNIVVEAEPYRPAGNRYGIRYEEALALECAYLRSQQRSK